jgi:hypothetical protein
MFTRKREYRSHRNNWFFRGIALIALIVISVAGPAIGFANNTGAGTGAASAYAYCPPLPGRYIWPPTVPDAALGVAYYVPLTYSAGSGQWSIVGGALPPGLGISSSDGAISGMPTAIGTFNFTVRVNKLHEINCSAARSYTMKVNLAASVTALTVSDEPVAEGQKLTLTAQVTKQTGPAPTGTVNFDIDGSPLSSPVTMSGGIASIIITAPGGGSDGYFTVTATYSGDNNTLPSNNSVAVTVYEYSLQDDTSGDLLFFSSNGIYMFLHCDGRSSFVLKGRGMIIPTAASCTILLEHVAADRDLTAEANTCDNYGSAKLVYQGVTYIISESDMRDNTSGCRQGTSL